MRAGSGQHHMHNHVAQVEQHPFAGVFAFHAADVFAGFFHFFAHVVNQCTGLAIGVARRDHHALEQRGQFAGVEHADVAALDVLERVDD